MSGAPFPQPEVVAATIRAFLAACGGERASALVDRGPQPPFLVEAGATGVAELTEGEDMRPLAAAAEPLALPHVHAFPPLQVDAAQAEITAPMGAVAHLARAVRELARQLGGRSVLTVEWQTTDPDAPLAIAARGDEPLLLVIGEEDFAMPADWP
ncbi:MAG: hypothetical protein ACR2ML_11475 [Solirubrobacteraceae bacterium]